MGAIMNRVIRKTERRGLDSLVLRVGVFSSGAEEGSRPGVSRFRLSACVHELMKANDGHGEETANLSLPNQTTLIETLLISLCSHPWNTARRTITSNCSGMHKMELVLWFF